MGYLSSIREDFTTGSGGGKGYLIFNNPSSVMDFWGLLAFPHKRYHLIRIESFGSPESPVRACRRVLHS
jgi:hypothetical protein